MAVLKASAQERVINSSAFSVGGELAIPTFGLYSIGTGVSAKFEMPVVSPVSFSLTGGFTSVFYKGNPLGEGNTPAAALFAPVKAGLKYYLIQNVYAEGEAGSAIELNHERNDLFAFSFGLGFIIPEGKNGVDIGFRYEDWQGQLRQTALRVAYRFGW